MQKLAVMAASLPSTHIDVNSGSNVFSQPNNVVNHLFIMRLDFFLYITFM